MNLSALINFQSNKKRLEEIKKNRKNIVPFVGTGISKGCGLYTWGELLHKLAVDYLTTEEIHSLESTRDYFEYADQVVAAAGNSDMIMKKIREIFSEKEVYLTEIPYLLVSAFSPMVITTNYDTLLEEASNSSALGPLKPLLPCLVGQMNEAIQINDRRLLKIHGSVEETQSFVFTTNQYRMFYGEKGNRENKFLPALLMKLFSGKKMLFVGCSLDKDHTLEILEECIQQNRSISHFAILPFPSDPDRQIQRNRELSKLCIEPIYYPEGDFEAVNKLINYLAEENNFIYSIKPILISNLGGDDTTSFQIQVLLSLLKESYYKTAIRFPSLLDIDNVKDDFTEDILAFIGTYRHQTDTILNLCKDAFSAYARAGYLRCEKEAIASFLEYFEDEALKENAIEPLLQKRWSIKHNLSNLIKTNLSWVSNLSNEDINIFSSDVLQKLQYTNGMSFADLMPVYDMAKKLIEFAEQRIDFEIRIKLLNSIGAFGHYFQDTETAIICLEKAINTIDTCGDTSRKLMLFKAKCYANLAIVKSLSSIDMHPVLDAAEKDVLLKRKYNESATLYSRSLNFYATVLKEIDPFRACDIYLEVADIKENIICDEQNSEQIRELTASWATTVFNMGLLAKDLELYDLAYRIIRYANQYRFRTIDYCNRDYCSSINVYAELELFVQEKQNIEWLIKGVESRIDLPKGFAETLAHTWYVCAYYYYLKKDYPASIRFINKSISTSNKKGALVDFRQDIRTKQLLANIKKSTFFKEEAKLILKDNMNRITALYGEDSYYLISPCRHLLNLTEEMEEIVKYKRIYNKLIQKYASAVKNVEEKLEAYISKHDK